MSHFTYVRTLGHGTRKALAIHCSLAHSGAWKGVAAALEDIATILAFDMPCHGRSDDWDGTGDMHDLVTAEGLKLLTEPMDLIGHSFGATVALRMACEAPELVRSLVLFESVWFAVAALDEPERITAYAARNAPFEDAMARGDRMEAARAFNRGWGDGTKWGAIPEATRRYMAERIHFVRASSPMVMHDSPGLLASGKLDALDMPVLLMQGEHSDDTVDAVNAAHARRLKDARRVTLQGAGHMAPITHPDLVAEEIRAFWAGIPVSAER